MTYKLNVSVSIYCFLTPDRGGEPFFCEGPLAITIHGPWKSAFWGRRVSRLSNAGIPSESCSEFWLLPLQSASLLMCLGAAGGWGAGMPAPRGDLNEVPGPRLCPGTALAIVTIYLGSEPAEEIFIWLLQQTNLKNKKPTECGVRLGLPWQDHSKYSGKL